MPRRTKPPRLLLRRPKGKPARWVILDDGRERGTGAAEGELQAAAKALARYIADKESKAPGPRNTTAALIAQVLRSYIDGHDKITDREKAAAEKLGQFFDRRVADDITPELCGEYVKWRTKQRRWDGRHGEGNVSVATAARELVILGAALSWNFHNRKLDKLIPVDVPPGGEPRQRFLTRHEAARLLRAARKLGYRHLCRFILLGLYTGTRHRALLELQWIRNTVGGHIDVQAGILYRRAEGAVETRKRRTPCPIPSRLMPHVRAWARQGGQYVVSWGGWTRDDETLTWEPAEASGKPIRSSVKKAWAAAREEAKLGEDVVPHTLKHTCASWMLQNGMTMFDVATALGTTEQVIQKVYGHHAQSRLREAMGQAFSGKRA